MVASILRPGTLLDRRREYDLFQLVEVGVLAAERLAVEGGDLDGALSVLIIEGRRAQEHLVRANLGLVAVAVRPFGEAYVPAADLAQAGTVGLVLAIHRFDHRRGIKFSTYAVPWIRKLVLEEMRTGRLLPLSDHAMRRLNQQRHAERAAADSAHQGVSTTSATPGDAGRLRQASALPLSLNAPLGDTDLTLEDLLVDPAEPLDDQLADVTQLLQLRRAIARLPATEQAVLQLMYGLTNTARLPVKAVAAQLGITERRVQEIEREALQGLTQQMRNT